MIFLTGATGTIGSATAAALKKAGANFKIGARSPDKAQATGGDAVKFDWDDFSTYLPAMKGCDKLFLLTPISDRGLGYTMQAVAAAKRAGIEHIVKVSVVGCDSDPGIMLGRNHFAGEREVKFSGLGYTMLRPTFFMQNFVNYYGVDLKKDCQVYLSHAAGKASYVDARDVGEVAAAVMTKPGHDKKVYDLTGPEALSDAECLALIGKAVGHSYSYVPVTPEAAAQAMETMGTPLWMIDGFAGLDWLIAQGYAAGVADGVEQVLGRKATSFADFAQSLAR